jgi:hypothetical protein
MSKQIRICEIPGYVKARYGFTLSRQSAYNWCKKGVRCEQLEYTTIPNPSSSEKNKFIRVTTTDAVDEFLRRTCAV